MSKGSLDNLEQKGSEMPVPRTGELDETIY